MGGSTNLIASLTYCGKSREPGYNNDDTSGVVVPVHGRRQLRGSGDLGAERHLFVRHQECKVGLGIRCQHHALRDDPGHRLWLEVDYRHHVLSQQLLLGVVGLYPSRALLQPQRAEVDLEAIERLSGNRYVVDLYYPAN